VLQLVLDVLFALVMGMLEPDLMRIVPLEVPHHLLPRTRHSVKL
jgi:hypothetical protein